MAKRWLKIEVEKTQTAVIYVRVDDAVTPLKPAETPKPARRGKGRPRGTQYLPTPQIQYLAEQAAEEALIELDWDEGNLAVGDIVEVSEREAKEFPNYDAAGG